MTSTGERLKCRAVRHSDVQARGDGAASGYEFVTSASGTKKTRPNLEDARLRGM